MSPRAPDHPLSHDQIIAEECARLLPNADHAEPLAALCLSGGGIRSATFALGVLEALARFGLLGQFHYLSTVSGGGYIGSWLTAWRAHANDDAQVLHALDRFASPDGREAPQVQALRANSNYLTPKLGILSADTWAAFALIVRNLVLNWLVFGPLFLGVLFLPKFAASALALAGPASPHPPTPWIIAGALLATAGLAVAVAARLRAAGRWIDEARFLALVATPLALAAIAMTVGLRFWLDTSLLGGAACGAAGYALAWCLGVSIWRRTTPAPARARAHLVWYGDLLAFAAAGATAGLIFAAGLHVVATQSPGAATWVVVAPAWALLALALADIAFVGLDSFAARGEQDREWLARYGGWLLALAATAALICAVDLFLPGALFWTWHRLVAYLAGLGLSGAVTLLLGPSRFTAATAARKAHEPRSLSTLVSLAALIFAIGLAGALSAADDRLLQWLAGTATIDPAAAAPRQLAAGLALTALALAASYCVNVNRFSLHALYRNRLVRAFLGSARAGATPPRTPDPFSRFDPADNLPMAQTIAATTGPNQGQGLRLFHVINMTLNVVATDNLAWQERKAEPFTVTALHAGNATVGYRPTHRFGDPAGGITLGTAMAISGAAISPNAGYNSSPLVGMLLTLFNLRLGWWLGNPRGRAYRRDGPKPGLWPALAELAGQTNDRSRWIYLSDGGHFEDLGLYPMIARGCRRIVVSDAGCDPASAFEDLGNAVRKIYIDLGVSIDFETFDIPARQSPPKPGFYCAIGTIRYPNDTEPGWLLYLKPGYRGLEPLQIRSYANTHETFPHESTAEQWFTESQFEAYRALGAYITERICTGGSGVAPGQTPTPMPLDELHAQAKRYLG